MYDQLHLYGNEADEASHDYESPVRAHTVGGAPTALYSKAKQTYPSTKSEGHLAAMYQNKSDVSNKVRVFERLASQEQTPREGMVYSDVRYWPEFYLCMDALFLVSRRDVVINCTFQKTTEYCQWNRLKYYFSVPILKFVLLC